MIDGKERYLTVVTLRLIRKKLAEVKEVLLSTGSRIMLNIIRFKGCKRCGGDLFLERDSEGLYVSCLQCGAIPVKQTAPIYPPPERKTRRVPVTR